MSEELDQVSKCPVCGKPACPCCTQATCDSPRDCADVIMARALADMREKLPRKRYKLVPVTDGEAL